MRFAKPVRVCPLFVVCALFVASCAWQGESEAGVTLFEGARLIPGDGSAAIENSVFAVENGVFILVGQQGNAQLPEGATQVDLTGKTVMPAKIDLHAHFML